MLSTYYTLLEAGADPAAVNNVYSMGMIVSMVFVFVVFYFMAIRPQKKQEEEQKKMRDSLQVGDEVVTIGGIIGFIVSKKDDTVILETGGNRSKIIVKLSAISQNLTQHDAEEEIAKKK